MIAAPTLSADPAGNERMNAATESLSAGYHRVWVDEHLFREHPEAAIALAGQHNSLDFFIDYSQSSGHALDKNGDTVLVSTSSDELDHVVLAHSTLGRMSSHVDRDDRWQMGLRKRDIAFRTTPSFDHKREFVTFAYDTNGTYVLRRLRADFAMLQADHVDLRQPDQIIHIDYKRRSLDDHGILPRNNMPPEQLTLYHGSQMRLAVGFDAERRLDSESLVVFNRDGAENTALSTHARNGLEILTKYDGCFPQNWLGIGEETQVAQIRTIAQKCGL